MLAEPTQNKIAMSILRIKSQNLDLELVLDGSDASSLKWEGATGAAAQSPEAQLHAALIALALSNCVSNSDHDEESGIITIIHKPTEWNSKAFGFTNTNF